MRFLEDSTEIPGELIRAVTHGTAVFLCEAGASMRAEYDHALRSLRNERTDPGHLRG